MLPKNKSELSRVMTMLQSMASDDLVKLPEVDTKIIDQKIAKFEKRLEVEQDDDFKLALEAKLLKLRQEREALLSDTGALLQLIEKHYPETSGRKVHLRMPNGSYRFGKTGTHNFDVLVDNGHIHIYRDNDYYLSIPNMSASRLSHTLVSIGKNSPDHMIIDESNFTIFNVVRNGQVRTKFDANLALEKPEHSRMRLFTVRDKFE